MLNDRYDQLQLIGEGVSAKVYKAIDRATQSTVAVKVLNPHLRTDPISLERFRREVQITRFLNHPQIVSIFDLVTDAEQTWLVMEYLDGPDLKAFIRMHAPIAIDIAVDLLKQILKILSVCHAKNVVHRDLKPQNIIVTASPLLARLLDFGISRMTALNDLTQTGTSLGSPEYMAPELFASNTYDPRTDIYALGVIAFELVGGVLPFQGDSLAVLFNEHLNTPVPPLTRLRADAPAWLQQLIERMLAKHGYERYQSVDEVLGDLERKRVIARQLPMVRKRECVVCHTDTIAELPVCTFCGHNLFDGLTAGSCELYCARGEDRQRLRQYFQSVFGTRLPAADGTLLLSGIDRFSAEAIKKSALAHGLYFTIAEQSSALATKRNLSTLLLLPIVVWLLAFLASPLVSLVSTVRTTVAFWSGPERWAWLGGFGTSEATTVCWICIMTLFGWGAFHFYHGEHQTPVFADPTRLSTQISRRLGWLQDVVPFFKAEAGEPLKRLVAQLVEKYVALVSAGDRFGAEYASRLQQLIVGAGRVASVMAEVEWRLDDSRLVELSARHASLSEQLHAETAAARKDTLATLLEDAAAQLRALYALEEKYSWLTNRLVYLQYLFNTVLGRVLVTRGTIEARETEMIETCARGLEDDLLLSREIQAELGRLR